MNGALLYLVVPIRQGVTTPGGMMLVPVLLLFVTAAACEERAAAPVVVDTAQGRVSSEVRESRSGRPYHAFTGLPYAKPPLGNLRFAEPQVPDSWKGVRGPTAEPLCSQYNIFLEDPALRVIGQEDCLYLSVYTPKVGVKENMAVIVWIHGGGFVTGAGPGLYGPQFFMDEDVVVVMFNYRLGALGFLSAEESWLPGNLGLKDQTMALRWVNVNIRQFGGDPKSVTIFGQSAGAASVHYHMMSQLSKGLFVRAIAASGSGNSPWALIPRGLAKARVLNTTRMLNCPRTTSPGEVLACLRNVSADDLAGLHGKFIKWHVDPTVVFGPVVESAHVPGSFLTTDPHSAVTYAPLLTGITSAEGSIKVAALDRVPGAWKQLDRDFAKLAPVSLLYGQTVSDPDAVTRKIRSFYFGTKPIGRQTSENVTNLYSDYWFVYPETETVTRHRGPLYRYYFDYVGQTSFLDWYDGKKFATGATHIDDMLYLFNLTALLPNQKHDPAELQLSKRMVKMWTNFARCGTPTSRGSEFDWKPSSGPNFLNIGKQGLGMRSCQSADLLARIDFWRRVLSRPPLRRGAPSPTC